jgi:hypothetical protein
MKLKRAAILIVALVAVHIADGIVLKSDAVGQQTVPPAAGQSGPIEMMPPMGPGMMPPPGSPGGLGIGPGTIRPPIMPLSPGMAPSAPCMGLGKEMMHTDAKTRGQFMQVCGRLMREMGDWMEKRGKEIEQGK